MTEDALRTASRSTGRPPRSILFVASSAEHYGSDRVLLQTVEAVRDEFACTVAVPGDGPLVADLTALGVEVVCLPDYALRRRYMTARGAPMLGARNVLAAQRLISAHRSERPALVYTNTEAVPVGAAVAAALGRPHLWHVHEMLPEGRASAALAAVVDRSSTVVVANSWSTRSHLIRQRPRFRTPVQVVLNGVATPQLIAPQARPADVLHVGCVGRIHPWKGQELALDAFTLARGRPGPWRELHLHLFGDALPENRDLVRRLQATVTARSLGDVVHFHGFVDRSEDIYPLLDVLLAPSTEPEPYSLVCAEAQSYGVPVVAPGRGGPSEIVLHRRSGHLVEGHDPEAWADALLTVAADRATIERLGAAGRAQARSRLSAARYQDEMRALVEHLTSGADTGSPSW